MVITSWTTCVEFGIKAGPILGSIEYCSVLEFPSPNGWRLLKYGLVDDSKHSEAQVKSIAFLERERPQKRAQNQLVFPLFIEKFVVIDR